MAGRADSDAEVVREWLIEAGRPHDLPGSPVGVPESQLVLNTLSDHFREIVVIPGNHDGRPPWPIVSRLRS